MSVWKNWARTILARWIKVPPEPHPPAGSARSVQIFRASENYFRLKQLSWLVKQLWIVGLALFFAFGMHEALSEGRLRIPEGRGPAFLMSSWFNAGFMTLHLLPLILELISMPFTYALAWLDFDQRWYIATDRSLRIREGIWRVREMTLTFANIQQMTVRQGPVQRFLGISDLVVTTAGGGGSAGAPAEAGQAKSEPVHMGILRGVSNAEQIRDLILSRMRQLKDAGLGDPEDVDSSEVTVASASGLADSRGLSGNFEACGRAGLLESARALLVEARALRSTVESRGGANSVETTSPPPVRWQKM